MHRTHARDNLMYVSIGTTAANSPPGCDLRRDFEDAFDLDRHFLVKPPTGRPRRQQRRARFPSRGPDRVCLVIAVEKAARRTLGFVHNPVEAVGWVKFASANWTSGGATSADRVHGASRSRAPWKRVKPEPFLTGC